MQIITTTTFSITTPTFQRLVDRSHYEYVSYPSLSLCARRTICFSAVEILEAWETSPSILEIRGEQWRRLESLLRMGLPMDSVDVIRDRRFDALILADLAGDVDGVDSESEFNKEHDERPLRISALGIAAGDDNDPDDNCFFMSDSGPGGVGARGDGDDTVDAGEGVAPGVPKRFRLTELRRPVSSMVNTDGVNAGSGVSS